MRCVQIVDPSIHDTLPTGMKINCFTKHHAEWLPNADYGDVVIIRRVKVLSSYLKFLISSDSPPESRFKATEARLPAPDITIN